MTATHDTTLANILAAAEESETGKILADHYREHGELSGESLLEAARAKDHPLHDRFNWNDSEAAERYRLQQAKQIIRSVKVRVLTKDEDDQPQTTRVRAFVSTKGMTIHDTTRYAPVAQVVQDPDQREVLLRRFAEDFSAFKRRWRNLGDFTDLVIEQLAKDEQD